MRILGFGYGHPALCSYFDGLVIYFHFIETHTIQDKTPGEGYLIMPWSLRVLFPTDEYAE